MIARHFKIFVLVCLLISLGIGFAVTDFNEAEERGENTEYSSNTISTGSMPADTMEERAKMRKLTAMADYNSTG